MAKELWIIWLAFLSSIIMYPLIAFLALPIEEPERNTMLLSVFSMVALGGAIASVILKNRMVTPKLENKTIDLSTEAGKKQYQSLLIVIWALSEISAVLGICYVVVSQDFLASLFFYLVSLVLMVIHMPRMVTSPAQP